MKTNALKLAVLALAVFCLTAVPPAMAEQKNQAYWVDAATGAVIDQLNLNGDLAKVIRLVAEIPAGKTLKAYSFMIMLEDVLSVEKTAAAPGSVLPPVLINDAEHGFVNANCFNTEGVQGVPGVSLVDVTVKALTGGESNISVVFTAFGSDVSDEFKPAAAPLKVVAE